ncbi:MAG: hypothetical protein NDI69_16150 [Bacteriovoracaceae bacterium]|nr:hypothetical protein [Bacteriovoracaceae bacterium]
MKMFLFLLLVCSQAFGQSTTTVNTTQSDSTPFSLLRLKEKFKISYFSETLGPSIKKWQDNEVNDDGTAADDPTTMYHSLNVRYVLNQKVDLYMSPRFSTVFGNRSELPDYWDKNAVRNDDWQFGFYYNFIKNPTLQYRQRLTHRAPFSKKSKSENIDSQIEWQHDFTYLVSPAIRIILWNNYRFYAYNEEATSERYRVNFTTLVNYTLNDKWLLQVMHDWDMQHRTTTDQSSPKHRDFWYMKKYNNYLSFGAGYSPVRDLTFIPFLRFLDETNIRNETTIVGLTILGRVL